MKNLILPFCFLVLLISSCNDKKSKTETEVLENPEKIIQLEKENQEIKTLEEKINTDIKEIDALLEDI